MKITLTKLALFKVIREVSSIIKASESPILQCVKITATGSKIEVESNQSNISMVSQCEARVHAEGVTLLPAQLIMKLLGSVPNDELVTLSGSHLKLKISSRNSQYTLEIPEIAEFTDSEAIPDDQLISSFTLPVKHLLSNLLKVSKSMANQDIRYYLNGVLWDLKEGDNNISLVATDGHRLNLSKLNTGSPLKLASKIILPRISVIALIKLLKSGGVKSVNDLNNQVNVALSEHQFNFVTNSGELRSDVVEGNYPEYEKVILDKPYYANIDTKAVLSICKSLALFQKHFKKHSAILKIKEKVIQISSHEKENSALHYVNINVPDSKLSKTPLTIGLRINYLQDALQFIDSEFCNMQYESESSSIILTAESGNCFVIMPVKL